MSVRAAAGLEGGANGLGSTTGSHEAARDVADATLWRSPCRRCIHSNAPPGTDSSLLRRMYKVRSTPPTLLVIEDAQDQALLVSIAARRSHPGLRVRVATDGFEGAAYLAGIHPFEDRLQDPLPDLVILDLFMPGVDGFAVLAWLRKQPELTNIPVVVLTSSGNPDDETRARWLGARVVYRKPDDLSELGQVVREIVQTYIPRSAMIDAWMTRGG